MQVESVVTSLLDMPEIQGAMMTTRDITGLNAGGTSDADGACPLSSC